MGGGCALRVGVGLAAACASRCPCRERGVLPEEAVAALFHMPPHQRQLSPKRRGIERPNPGGILQATYYGSWFWHSLIYEFVMHPSPTTCFRGSTSTFALSWSAASTARTGALCAQRISQAPSLCPNADGADGESREPLGLRAYRYVG